MSQLRRLLPSLNGLFAFEAAVRCGSFARAADDLGLTAPAISRSIARLEQHLDLKLFQRTPAGAILSEQGKILHRALQQGFSGIEAAVQDLRVRRGAALTVTLSVSSAFATHWFMPRLTAFQAAFPKVEIRFHLISGPLSGPVADADIAMRFDPQAGSQDHVQPLFAELMLPVAAPSFHSAQPTNMFLPALNRMINLSMAEPEWSDMVAGLFEPQDSGLVLSDYTVVVQAALLGQGMALGWLNVVSALLASGKLVPIGDRVLRTGRTCALVRRSDPASSVIARICDWIAERQHEDIAALDALHPHLGLAAAVPTIADLRQAAPAWHATA